MQVVDINWPLLIIQILNILLILCIPIFDIIALRQLSHRRLTEIVRVLWVIVILCIPILGALAFWLTRPGLSDNQGVQQQAL